MNYGITALLLAIAAPGLALAEHHGPIGLFLGKTAAEAADQIQAACTDRGFAATRLGPGDVYCQAEDLDRSVVAFKAKGPSDDPHSRPQIYHRFAASEGTGGAVVHERSEVVVRAGPNLIHVEPRFIEAKIINDRVLELYRSLGAVIQK